MFFTTVVCAKNEQKSCLTGSQKIEETNQNKKTIEETKGKEKRTRKVQKPPRAAISQVIDFQIFTIKGLKSLKFREFVAFNFYTLFQSFFLRLL